MLARLLAPVVCLLALATVGHSRGDGPVLPGPKASAWASWTIGSWVVYDIDNSTPARVSVKQALLAVDEDSFRTRDETTLETGSSKAESQISLASFGYPHAHPKAQLVATEVVSVQGKAYECQVWRARYSEEGTQWDAIAWVSPEVEQPLRIRVQGKHELALDVDKLEDFVSIGQRKFRCVRYAGSVTSDAGRSTIAQWRSAALPGALVRSVTTSEKDGKKSVFTMQVREFRGTKL